MSKFKCLLCEFVQQTTILRPSLFINDAGGKVENEDRCRLARGVRRASSLILQGVTPDDCKQFVQELLDLLGKDIRIRQSY